MLLWFFHGDTPLHLAWHCGFESVVQYLLNLEANVQIPNKLSHFPLHISSSQGNLKIFSNLVQKKADINVKSLKEILQYLGKIHCTLLLKRDIWVLLHFFLIKKSI